VLRRLAARFPDRYPLLLDSAASGPLSRASVLLAEPGAALWLGADGRLGAEGFVPQGTSFLGALENWWLTERDALLANAPSDAATGKLVFEGGWAVFLGYELARKSSRTWRCRAHRSRGRPSRAHALCSRARSGARAGIRGGRSPRRGRSGAHRR